MALGQNTGKLLLQWKLFKDIILQILETVNQPWCDITGDASQENLSSLPMKSSDNTRYLNSFADNNGTIPKRCTSSQPVEFTSCCSPEEEGKLTWGNITEDASQENLPYLPMESSDIKITRYLNSFDIADNNEPISKTYTSLQPVEFPSCCSPENNTGANNNEDKNERIISDENIFLAKESVGNFENEIAFETEVGGGNDYSFDNNSVQNSSEENAILSDDGCVFSPDENECNFTESREV
ncbi:hypothetical protein JTB14_022146 [Gonioctena quinquepunctata]|nr:hypothetical protein JTB14_022146 [Gonioctena quinquepunctata]